MGVANVCAKRSSPPNSMKRILATVKNSTRLLDAMRYVSCLIIASGYLVLGVYQVMLTVIPNDVASDAPEKYSISETDVFERAQFDLAISIGRDISEKMPNLLVPALLLAVGYYLNNKVSNTKIK